MRTFDSSPDEILPLSRALRDRDAHGIQLRHEDLGDVIVSSDALYFGAKSGENGVDGVVVRVPSGAYRVVATLAESAHGAPQLIAASVLLSNTTEAMRGALPGAAFWHDAPGELPLVAGDAIAVSDAAVRDQYRDPSWPWDGWQRDVVDPAVAAATAEGRSSATVTYPGRDDGIVVLGPIVGDAVLFAGFDDDRRPTALHLETLVTDVVSNGADAPPPWITQASAAESSPAAEPEPGASPFGLASQGSSSFGVQPSVGQPVAAQSSFGPPAGAPGFGLADESAASAPMNAAGHSAHASFAPQSSSPFGAPPQSSFGGAEQSSFGTPPSPAFGAPQHPTPPASPAEAPFGTESQSSFGAPPQTSFGAPGQSSFGAQAKSSLGTPAQSSFGAPARSSFGGPGQSSFGAPAPSPAPDQPADGARFDDVPAGDENAPISAAALGSLGPNETGPSPESLGAAPATAQFAIDEPQPFDAGHAGAAASKPAFSLRETPAPTPPPAPSTPADPNFGAAAPAAPVASEDPVVGLIVADAAAGAQAAERREPDAAISLLSKVTDSLAAGEDQRPGVILALRDASLSAPQLVDSLVDVLVTEHRAPEAIDRLGRALEIESLRGSGEETVHLRHRLGELQLRSGAVAEATATLETARGEADALASTTGPDASESAEVGRNYLAHITYDLATAQLRAGNAGPAAELALDAMRRFEGLRVARMAGRGAFLAASAYELLGHEGSRQHAFAEAERIFREGNELDGLGTALGYLAEADASRGDYQPAILKFEQARTLLEEAGELAAAAIASENEAICSEYLGDHNRAAELRGHAASLQQRAAATTSM